VLHCSLLGRVRFQGPQTGRRDPECYLGSDIKSKQALLFYARLLHRAQHAMQECDLQFKRLTDKRVGMVKDVIVAVEARKVEDYLCTVFKSTSHACTSLAHLVPSQDIAIVPLGWLLKDAPHHLTSPCRKHRKKRVAQLSSSLARLVSNSDMEHNLHHASFHSSLATRHQHLRQRSSL
jgi:hypothetical protein